MYWSTVELSTAETSGHYFYLMNLLQKWTKGPTQLKELHKFNLVVVFLHLLTTVNLVVLLYIYCIHLSTHTDDGEVAVYQCGVCQYGSFSYVDLLHHKRLHNDDATSSHLCHLCEYAANSKQALNKHIKAHSGEFQNNCWIFWVEFILDNMDRR